MRAPLYQLSYTALVDRGRLSALAGGRSLLTLFGAAILGAARLPIMASWDFSAKL